MTYDGISEFDSDQKVLYYATDTDSAFIFKADVQSGCLKAPISLAAQSIGTMNYDKLQKRMFISYHDAQGNLNVVAYSTQKKGYYLVNSLNNYKQDWVNTCVFYFLIH